jgi:hypothetical protein
MDQINQMGCTWAGKRGLVLLRRLLLLLSPALYACALALASASSSSASSSAK